MLFVAALFSLCIGVILGLLGGGGGILAVPMLVYVLGVAAKPAIASSLFFVGTTSAIGAALAARARRVRWKMGGLFAAGSMTGAFGGGKLARFVPESVLLATLATVMLVTALAMLRGRKEREGAARAISVHYILLIGALVGVVSGLVGAGGGFLIVPALTLFGGLAMHDAIGTSLLVIALQSLAGFAGHVGHVELDPQLLATMTGAAAIGMFTGTGLGKRISAQSLKRGFAAMVFVTGVFVLGRELPWQWTLPIVLCALVLAVFFVRQSARPARSST